MERTYAGAGEKCEDRAAERNCYVLTVTTLHPPCAGGGVEELGMKLSVRKKAGGGKVFFYLCLSLCKSILIGNKLN